MVSREADSRRGDNHAEGEEKDAMPREGNIGWIKGKKRRSKRERETVRDETEEAREPMETMETIQRRRPRKKRKESLGQDAEEAKKVELIGGRDIVIRGKRRCCLRQPRWCNPLQVTRNGIILGKDAHLSAPPGTPGTHGTQKRPGTRRRLHMHLGIPCLPMNERCGRQINLQFVISHLVFFGWRDPRHAQPRMRPSRAVNLLHERR